MKTYFFRDVYSIFLKEMKDFLKDKSQVFMTISQPIIWLVLMGFGMSGLTSNTSTTSMILDGAPNYITYLTPGIMIMTALYGGLYGGVTLLSDIRFGYIYKLLSSPISRSSIVFGKIIAALLQTLLQVILVLLFSIILGVRYKTGLFGVLFILIIAALFCSIMVSVSLMLSLKFKTHNAIYSLVSFITLPLMFTSSAMFPNMGMPDWLKIITYVNPITYAVEPIRKLVISNWNLSAIGLDILVIFILAIIFVSLAIYSFNKKYNK